MAGSTQSRGHRDAHQNRDDLTGEHRLGYLARASLKTVFDEVREPPVVIRTGLYARMRHPMYFSEILLYAGLLALSLSLAAAAIWVAAIVFLTFLCRHEERLLIERFGADYRTYMREVPMWVPRPWKRAGRLQG